MAASALLVTKLHIPPNRPNLVARPHLRARLEECLLPGCRLLLVSAPAGFGKTALLSDWQATLAARGLPLAWLSLDEGDDDPARFLRYLIAALRRAAPALGEATLALLDQPQLPAIEMLLTSLVNEIAEAGRELLLVLEDYHLIRAAAVHAAVAFLLEHLPAGLHLVLLTRQDPPLPLARLRARGQVCELRAADLRFSAAETAEFLLARAGLRLGAEQIAALEARMEGWIAGLQMAALALRGSPTPDPDALLRGFSASHPFVFDYLAEEVLAQQPPELVEFLRQTAFLERLCPALCDAVTGQTGSQALLRRIEQANLFLTPLDEQQQWYRYHHLFADFLRSGAAAAPAAHQRAAQWFEHNRLFAEAVAHYRAAADWPALCRVILAAAMSLYMDGELGLLEEWLKALPEGLLRQDGALLTYQAMVMLMNRRLPEAAAVVAQAERVWDESIPPENRGCLDGVKAYLAHGAGQEEAALAFARRAIALLSDSQPGYRSMLLALIGQILLQAGRMAEAEACLIEAITLGAAKPNSIGMGVAQCTLGRAINMRGQRRRADDYFRGVVSQCVDARGRELPQSLFIYAVWATLAYDGDQLEATREYLEREFAYCRQMGIAPIVVGGLTTLALIQRAGGDLPAALHTLGEVRADAAQVQVPWVGRQAAALEAMLRLQSGDLPAAAAWAAAAALDLASPAVVEREFELTCLARVYIAQGRAHEALALLGPLAAAAQQGDCRRSLITLELLQALAAANLGQADEAREHTTRALALAAAQGYARAFLDEGLALAPLLSAALPKLSGEERTFARALLARLSGGEALAPPPAPAAHQPLAPAALVEPLSPRELEVLALMAAGFSKAEIARKLFLTVNTLKAHTHSIYGKLDVHSSMQAVIKARELGLI